MEHKEKFQSSLAEINVMSYTIIDGESWRTFNNISTQCYGGLNVANNIYDTINELWVHTFETTPPHMNGDIGEEYEKVATIYEAIDCVEIDVVEDHRELIDIDDVPSDYFQ